MDTHETRSSKDCRYGVVCDVVLHNIQIKDQ